MPFKKGNVLYKKRPKQLAVNRLTEQDYKIQLSVANKEHGNREIVLVGPYLGKAIKTEHRCSLCGHIWEVRPSNLTNKLQGCPSCSPKKSQSISNIKKKLLSIYKDDVTFKVLKDCVARKTLTTIKATCSVCEYNWTPNLKNLLYKESGCPKCSGHYVDTESLIKSIKSRFGDTYNLSKVEYTGAYGLVKLKCTEHGWFTKTANSLRTNSHKHACPECSKNHVSNSHLYSREEVIKRFNKVHDNAFNYDKSVWNTVHDKILITCPKHGDFTKVVFNHYAGSSCPVCLPNTSRPHRLLQKLLDSKKIEYSSNNRQIIPSRELDIYIPKNRLGIEINGAYWHSSEFKDKNYHLHKSELCRDRGIKLLHLWDYEILNKPKIVASMIQARLGKSKTVYARKLNVAKIEGPLAKKWFDKTHLQGSVNSTVSYALINNLGELECVMAFSSSRFSDHQWEMTRFSSSLGKIIVGGASRLLSAFLKEHKPTSLVSYADLRISYGKVYKNLGFDFLHKSSPSYFYIRGITKLSRYQCQKHKLPKLLGNDFSSKLSERENMENLGYRRVYDCGNLVFQLNQDQINQHAFA